MAENMNESTTSEQEQDNEGGTITLNEMLELEDDLIEQSAAVLGAANDKSCSFIEGYMKRQALYSCLTCIPEARTDPDKRAGVCLACSFHCHDGHELVELYTKRNFRCDCGNSKFGEHKCNLFSDKTDVNDMNLYNQNFSGAYCTCHRPYPDPEDTIPDQMVQCIVCEDWFHERHLGTTVPTDNFAEMICESCVSQHQFLLHYDGLSLTPVDNSKTNDDEKVEIVKTETVTEEKATEDKPEVPEETKKEEKDCSDDAGCKKPKEKSDKVCAKFWRDDSWRKELCSCDDCLKMYENEEVAFLLDPDDPVSLYEEKSKAKAREFADSEDRKIMNSMDRVQLVEFISGYNDLKENLSEYLKKFGENKKVVRTEDIKEFFNGMQARKKQKVDIPYFCR